MTEAYGQFCNLLQRHRGTCQKCWEGGEFILKDPVAQWVNDSTVTHGFAATRSKRLKQGSQASLPTQHTTPHMKHRALCLICFLPPPSPRIRSNPILSPKPGPGPQDSSLPSTSPTHNTGPHPTLYSGFSGNALCPYLLLISPTHIDQRKG